ncbi:MAG TPA: molybdenum cofactor guanylyltransferase [Ktedonobacterales bacterium]|nr:molybdenum cofactor guanylyltransferase [Ktedonobacterales bacterium]
MKSDVGVILAGGRSSRMGENKAEMVFGGEPLLARVARRLSLAVDELLVIGPQSLAPLAPRARVVEDALPALGPLGGLYTALTVGTASTSAHIFLVACDMPFISLGLVRAMLAFAGTRGDADVVALEANGRVQPLHAVYSRACLPAVERALEARDHSLHALLAQLAVVAIDAEIVRREDPEGLSAFNVNTPEDWQQALRLDEQAVRHNQITGDQ